MKAWEFKATAEVIDELAKDISQAMIDKGFWSVPGALQEVMHADPEVARFVDDLIATRKMALVTTETSECVEAIRKPQTESGVTGYSNEEEEVADQIIRLLDYSGKRNLRIGECIHAKMQVNLGRPFQHGKKF